MIKKIILILVISWYSTVVLTCKTHKDCWPCYNCDNQTHECVLVPAYSDPNNDCLPICDTATVCSEFGHCSLSKKPSCECDYETQHCKEVKSVMLNNVDISNSIYEDSWLTYKKEEIISFLKIQTILCLLSVGCFISILCIIARPQYRNIVLMDNKLQ